MDSNLDQKNFWDEQSCREFETFLDDWHEAQETDEFVRTISGGMFQGVDDMTAQMWGKK